METALLAKNLLGKKKKTLKPREKSVILQSTKILNSMGNDSNLTLKLKDDKKPENLLDKIEKNLESTRIFIKKMEKCKETVKDPSKMLQKMEKIAEKEANEPKSHPEEPIINKEMRPYFQSLNKIEDTIRFLETNLNEAKENPNFPMISPKITNFLSPEDKTLPQKFENLSTVSKDMKTFFLSPDNPLGASLKDDLNNDLSLINEKKMVEVSYQSIKKTFRNDEEKENAPISFDITAKSRSFDEEMDNQRDSLLNSLIKNEEIQIQKLNPMLFFKNVQSYDGNDSDKENWGENLGASMRNEEQQPTKPKKVIFSEIEGKNLKPAHQNSEDEEDNMIEKIKNMLENTKTELTKMNQVNFDFPNYQILGNEPQTNYDKNDNNRKEFFFENGVERKKTEKLITVEPALRPLSSNFNVKINNSNMNFVKINNHRIGNEEEDMPIPRKFNVVKMEEKKLENLGNKLFKKTSDSLNIRSFLK